MGLRVTTHRFRKKEICMSPIDNKIVIIGGDHHNTLAVVRDLGKHKCDIIIVLHVGKISLKNTKVAYSKYAKNRTVTVENSENAILEWLKEYKYEGNSRAILFPCSDLAAYTIDKHFCELNEKYIGPGFVNSPGKVAQLMDKFEQKKFADKHNICMAHTWEMSTDVKCNDTQIVKFPCIVKPIVSAFGNKGDITICNNEQDLIASFEKFHRFGFERVLVQEFILKQYEVCSYGCITNQVVGDYR